MRDRQNITRIKAVHNALEEFASEVVYVGGATVSFYTDRPAGEPRPTDDVDIVVELVNYAGFAEIEDKLRQKGFVNDQQSGIICRFIIQGIIVDIMPTDEDVLGFKNKWYPAGFASSSSFALDENVSVRIFRPEYFLASKLDAFNDRGNEDGRLSSDFEDIVYLLNNRNTIWDEIRSAEPQVGNYIIEEFKKLMENEDLEEWVSAHLEYHEQRRVRMILREIQSITEI